MFVSALVIWVSFLPDPMGGEPTAVVQVDRSKSGVPLKDIAVATPGKPEAPAGDPPPAARFVDVVQTPVAAPPASSDDPAPGHAGGRTAAAGRRSAVSARIPAASAYFHASPATLQPMEVLATGGQALGRHAARRLIIGGLGLSQVGTQEALRLMPPDVTLAFAPYGSDLERWATRARQDGHDSSSRCRWSRSTIPTMTPGPQTLLSSALRPTTISAAALGDVAHHHLCRRDPTTWAAS